MTCDHTQTETKQVKTYQSTQKNQLEGIVPLLYGITEVVNEEDLMIKFLYV